MKNVFNTRIRHSVSEANINCYATPFIHPARTMAEHDFIYLLEGEWKMGQNNEIFSLKKDSLLILGAHQHHYGVSPCAADTKTMYFHVSCEEGDRLLPASGTADKGISILTDASVNGNLKQYFYELVNAKLAGNQEKANIFFDLLICELSSSVPHRKNSEVNKEIRQIKEIIHNHPERFPSNAELAELCGVSLKTAETKFKAYYGVTIHQYILRFKIDQAISCFRNFPEMSSKEIAYNLGFYDEYHFSKQFKKLIGISPAQYRKTLRSDAVK